MYEELIERLRKAPPPLNQQQLEAYQMRMDAADAIAKLQAERDAAVVLPCKVGDKFWTVYCEKVQKVKVSMITQKADGSWNVRFSVFNGWGSSINGSVDVIGKTVFLTREEAEAVLKRRADNG